MALNVVVLTGRLTRDPEIRYTQSQKPVASFSLATDRDYRGSDGERQTDFIPCVAWGSSAEFVQKYFHKGMKMDLRGRLQFRKWTDNEGKNRTSAEVIAEQINFGESRQQQSVTAPSPAQAAPGEPDAALTEQSRFTEIDGDDGEMPF